MRVLNILRKDLRLLLRDRGQIITLFLTPLAFIIPICLAFGPDGYVTVFDVKRPLPVANHDLVNGAAGEHAQALLDSLAESFAFDAPDAAWLGSLGLDGGACATPGPRCDEAFVRAAVAHGDRDAGIILPAGFSQSIDAGTPISVTVVYDAVGDAVERQLVLGIIEGSVTALSVQNRLSSGLDQFEDLLALAPDGLQQDIRSTVTESEDGTESASGPALNVVKILPQNYKLEVVPNTLQQTVPGYTVMFVFFLVGTVASGIRLEKSSGTLRRQLYSPTARSALLGGKLLAAFVVGVLQVMLMFAVGRLAFGMGLGSDLLGLLLITMAFSAVAVSFGLLAYSYGASNALSVPLIVAALVGGCMFPVSLLPPFLRTIGYAIPHTYAMTAYQDLMVRGQSLPAVLPEIGILLLFAGGAFLLAVRHFDFEGEDAS